MKKSSSLSKHIFLSMQLTLIAFLLPVAVRAAGEVDPSFTTAVQETTAGSVQTVVVQSDGKLLVGGNFTVAGNSARSSIARFNPDGTIDPTFDPPEFYSYEQQFPLSPEYVYIYAIAVQADGKILVGGNFVTVGDQGYRGVMRLNANGSVDSSFYVPIAPFSPANSTVYDIKVLGNNQIIIGGVFKALSLQTGVPDRDSLARLNSNGSLDQSFSQVPAGGVRSLVVQPDGKIVYANNQLVRRVNADGTADSSFSEAQVSNFNTVVNRIALQTDGKILIAGVFQSVNGFPQNNIARLTASGALDPTFNTNGTGASSEVKDVDITSDGKIIIGGQFTVFNGVQRLRNARLNADGTLDMSFNYTTLGNSINDVTALNDGKIVIGGSDSSGNWDKLSRLNVDGTLDTAFTGGVYQRGVVFKVVAQPDGKVLLAGAFRKVNGVRREGFARLNADGSLDPTFVANTAAPGGVPTGGVTIAYQADGKVIVAGPFGFINGVSKNYIARFNADGTLDTGFNVSFNFNVWIEEVVPLPDGKILLGGNMNTTSGFRNVVRLNNNGSYDTTFASVVASGAPAGFNAPVVRALEVQSDGKIVIGGQFTQVNNVLRGRIARLNADGTLDTTFNPPFGANSDVVDLAVQSDGSVVIGGYFTGLNGVNNIKYLARLLTDGNLDTSFNPAVDAPVFAVERQTNDKILIGGLFKIVNTVARSGIARINSNGTLDGSFAGAGTNDAVQSIFIQTDNKILIGGDFSRVNGVSAVNVARLLNAPISVRPFYDYDGDGRADLGVYRPSTGFWYQFSLQTNAFSARQFGASSDLIAPADYDGDGRYDIAVFRPGAFAYFYIYDSSTNAFRFSQFGTTGDVPMSGDWDGDGKADLAVYRAATSVGGQSNFYYRPSSQPGVDYLTIALGTLGDKPLYGDFDGDGRLDAAVFRASDTSWRILQSSNNQTIQTTFGVATDIPVPADYDGDGRANIAVFRPSNGTWYTSQNPATNYGAIQFGTNGDIPVPADYDGDGRADTAVFRPSNGGWYLNRTTSGFTGVQFGTAEDKPIPNAFIR